MLFAPIRNTRRAMSRERNKLLEELAVKVDDAWRHRDLEAKGSVPLSQELSSEYFLIKSRFPVSPFRLPGWRGLRALVALPPVLRLLGAMLQIWNLA